MRKESHIFLLTSMMAISWFNYILSLVRMRQEGREECWSAWTPTCRWIKEPWNQLITHGGQRGVKHWALKPTPFFQSFWNDYDGGLCWLVECTMIWVWLHHSNECNLLHLIAADSAQHQWMSNITCFEGFVQNQPVSCYIAVLCLARQTWWPLHIFV